MSSCPASKASKTQSMVGHGRHGRPTGYKFCVRSFHGKWLDDVHAGFLWISVVHYIRSHTHKHLHTYTYIISNAKKVASHLMPSQAFSTLCFVPWQASGCENFLAGSFRVQDFNPFAGGTKCPSYRNLPCVAFEQCMQCMINQMPSSTATMALSRVVDSLVISH